MLQSVIGDCWIHHDGYGWDDSEYCLTVLSGLQIYLHERRWTPRKETAESRDDDDDDDDPLFPGQPPGPPPKKFQRKSFEDLKAAKTLMDDRSPAV